MDDNVGVRWRSAVIQTEGVPTVQQQQAMLTDSVLQSLSPIINSMRLFGLYFIRKARANGTTAPDKSQRRVVRYQDWNFGRLYATAMLVVAWVNTVRYAAIFDGKETLGGDLFTKLGMIPSAVLGIVFQTAYYVASHSGSLDRVLRQVNLSMAEHSTRYSWRAKLITVACWLFVAFNTFFYVYQVFVTGAPLHNFMSLLPIGKTLSKHHIHVIRAVCVLLQVQFIGSWMFSQAMNFMVMTLLIEVSSAATLNSFVDVIRPSAAQSRKLIGFS